MRALRQALWRAERTTPSVTESGAHYAKRHSEHPDERSGNAAQGTDCGKYCAGHVGQEAPLGKLCAVFCPSCLPFKLPSTKRLLSRIFHQAVFIPERLLTSCLHQAASIGSTTQRCLIRQAARRKTGSPAREASRWYSGMVQRDGTAGCIAPITPRTPRTGTDNNRAKEVHQKALQCAAPAECKCPPSYARSRIGRGESGGKSPA